LNRAPAICHRPPARAASASWAPSIAPETPIKKGASGAFFLTDFSDQAEKDDPQPQVEVAFGFLITNCAPSAFS